MWVKTVLSDNGIEAFWQPRTVVNKSRLVVLDGNGAPMSDEPIQEAEYPDAMISAGVVNIDDEFALYCGELFDDGLAAVMRHVAEAISAGYGDGPEEVVEWYNDFQDAKFLDGLNFKFVDSVDPFMDLVGNRCSVSVNSDGEFVADIIVDDEHFDVVLESDEMILSFVLCTSPV